MRLVTLADNTRPQNRCDLSKDNEFQPWLKERKIVDVEAFVPDMRFSM